MISAFYGDFEEKQVKTLIKYMYSGHSPPGWGLYPSQFVIRNRFGGGGGDIYLYEGSIYTGDYAVREHRFFYFRFRLFGSL